MKEFYDDMIQVLESEREVRSACLGITHVIDCGQIQLVFLMLHLEKIEQKS